MPFSLHDALRDGACNLLDFCDFPTLYNIQATSTKCRLAVSSYTFRGRNLLSYAATITVRVSHTQWCSVFPSCHFAIVQHDDVASVGAATSLRLVAPKSAWAPTVRAIPDALYLDSVNVSGGVFLAQHICMFDCTAPGGSKFAFPHATTVSYWGADAALGAAVFNASRHANDVTLHGVKLHGQVQATALHLTNCNVCLDFAGPHVRTLSVDWVVSPFGCCMSGRDLERLARACPLVQHVSINIDHPLERWEGSPDDIFRVLTHWESRLTSLSLHLPLEQHEGKDKWHCAISEKLASQLVGPQLRHFELTAPDETTHSAFRLALMCRWTEALAATTVDADYVLDLARCTLVPMAPTHEWFPLETRQILRNVTTMLQVARGRDRDVVALAAKHWGQLLCTDTFYTSNFSLMSDDVDALVQHGLHVQPMAVLQVLLRLRELRQGIDVGLCKPPALDAHLACIFALLAARPSFAHC